MAEFTITIRGIKETQRALYSYSQQLGDKIVLKALTSGARPFVTQARANAPSRTGRLKRAIFVKRSRIYNGKRLSNKLGVYVGVRRGRSRDDPRGAYYANFMENGWHDRGRRWHEGRRFMFRAFLSQRETAVRIAVAEIKIGSDIVKRRVGFR